MSNRNAYNKEFYASVDAGSLSSAREVVPAVLELLPSASVIDIGCGTGCWLSVFADNGVKEIVGVDGMHVTKDQLRIPAENFLGHDLSKPFDAGREFDLAISLEVAEHLPESSADHFVDLLCGLSSAILFSAAVPGQGGVEHINEQWPDYWTKKFAARGYMVFDPLRLSLWQNSKIEPWYKQNLLIYVRSESAGNYPELAKFCVAGPSPHALVHPDVFIESHKPLNRRIVKTALKIDAALRAFFRKNG